MPTRPAADRSSPADCPAVLVIDDAPHNAEIINGYLADRYDVRFAFSGMEALTLLTRSMPDLILLDIMMPGLDGYAVCAALKRDPHTRDIPVMFVTARNDAASEARALEAGAVDFISKPINPPVLRARVDMQMKLKRQHDELRRLATTDALTGVANRRVFTDTLEAEWRRAVRRESPLALMMIDVDFFKAYNDYYGHPAGDHCLARVAETLAGSVGRAGDLVARYGGEEFAVLLPDMPYEQASHLARRIHERVRDLDLPHAASAIAGQVTVSVGLAVASPGGMNTAEGDERSAAATVHPTAALLLREADQALYAAKETGRNRVVAKTMTLQCRRDRFRGLTKAGG